MGPVDINSKAWGHIQKKHTHTQTPIDINTLNIGAQAIPYKMMVKNSLPDPAHHPGPRRVARVASRDRSFQAAAALYGKSLLFLTF